jgi:hypothetical protein
LAVSTVPDGFDRDRLYAQVAALRRRRPALRDLEDIELVEPTQPAVAAAAYEPVEMRVGVGDEAARDGDETVGQQRRSCE